MTITKFGVAVHCVSCLQLHDCDPRLLVDGVHPSLLAPGRARSHSLRAIYSDLMASKIEVSHAVDGKALSCVSAAMKLSSTVFSWDLADF